MIKKHIMEHSFIKREKRIFTINVSTIPPDQVEAYVKAMKEYIRGNSMVFNNISPL